MFFFRRLIVLNHAIEINVELKLGYPQISCFIIMFHINMIQCIYNMCISCILTYLLIYVLYDTYLLVYQIYHIWFYIYQYMFYISNGKLKIYHGSPFSEPLWCQALQVNASNSVLRCYLGMAGEPCVDG